MNELYAALETTHSELECWIGNTLRAVIEKGLSEGESYKTNQTFTLGALNYNLHININDSYEVALKISAIGDFEIDFLECSVRHKVDRHSSTAYMQAGAPHQLMDNRSSNLSRSSHNALAASMLYQLTEYAFNNYGEKLTQRLISAFN